jgi:hypothetical protein
LLPQLLAQALHTLVRRLPCRLQPAQANHLLPVVAHQHPPPPIQLAHYQAPRGQQTVATAAAAPKVAHAARTRHQALVAPLLLHTVRLDPPVGDPRTKS